MDIAEDVTPSHLKCGVGTCVTVYRLTNGDLMIIGKKPPSYLEKEIQDRVGEDEQIIIIDPAYFSAI